MSARRLQAATFVRAVGRPNNDPLDRELHRCIAEERDVARFTAALGHQRRFNRVAKKSVHAPVADVGVVRAPHRHEHRNLSELLFIW
jgi:hypothetical protein